MLTIGKMALTIATGGILLGALLGKAADPVMKRSPEPASGHALPAPAADGPQEAQAFVADFAPATGPDRYAPAWADDAEVAREPVYPDWTYSDFSDESAGPGEEPRLEPIIEPLAAEDPTSPAPRAEPAAIAAAPADGLGPLY